LGAGFGCGGGGGGDFLNIELIVFLRLLSNLREFGCVIFSGIGCFICSTLS
jgi:hypothetical protein